MVCHTVCCYRRLEAVLLLLLNNNSIWIEIYSQRCTAQDLWVCAELQSCEGFVLLLCIWHSTWKNWILLILKFWIDNEKPTLREASTETTVAATGVWPKADINDVLRRGDWKRKSVATHVGKQRRRYSWTIVDLQRDTDVYTYTYTYKHAYINTEGVQHFFVVLLQEISGSEKNLWGTKSQSILSTI